ncbi:hypothetical protein AAC387_Pa12g1192 [Persea americana]
MHAPWRSYRDGPAPKEIDLTTPLQSTFTSNIRFLEAPAHLSTAPIVSFTASELEQAWKAHAFILIAQCQGSRIPTRFFRNRINQLWRSKDKLSIVEL